VQFTCFVKLGDRRGSISEDCLWVLLMNQTALILEIIKLFWSQSSHFFSFFPLQSIFDSDFNEHLDDVFMFCHQFKYVGKFVNWECETIFFNVQHYIECWYILKFCQAPWLMPIIPVTKEAEIRRYHSSRPAWEKLARPHLFQPTSWPWCCVSTVQATEKATGRRIIV
jgi:hypothetical protein